MKCQTCGDEYSLACDYRQGRCPHHPPLINIDHLHLKFYNLITAIKEWFKR
jgi:hypothetical protein